MLIVERSSNTYMVVLENYLQSQLPTSMTTSPNPCGHIPNHTYSTCLRSVKVRMVSVGGAAGICSFRGHKLVHVRILGRMRKMHKPFGAEIVGRALCCTRGRRMVVSVRVNGEQKRLTVLWYYLAWTLPKQYRPHCT